MSSNRKIRVLIAKPGLDGHDRGVKVVARGLRDAGMEVIYLGLRLTPEQIAEAAIQEDMLIIGGGIIPKKDIPELKKAGITRIFGPGTPIDEISNFIRENLAGRDDDKEN